VAKKTKEVKMCQKKEKNFTKKTLIELILLLVTLFFVVILFTQCSTKPSPLNLPPLKVNRPEPKKPTPPPPPPPAPKKAKDKVAEEGIVMGLACGIEGGVEGGIEGEVEGGVVSGVLGAPGTDTTYALRANMDMKACGTYYFMAEPSHSFNTEEYSRIYESRFLETLDNPLSTFSIDVDTGSYANVRRFLNHSQLPPKDAVRIEEMINYFEYDYPQPQGKQPFSVNTQLAACPWNSSAQLLHIGIRGKRLESNELPPSNLVFLLDVSGSMTPPNKLPLLISSFKLLVKELTSKDKVAIVVYAGAAGLVLPSTPGDQKEKILEILDKLNAGGSTAGGAGIQLAYKIAEENFIREGNNRIILATDGDFNVGVSSTSELIRMTEEKKEKGIFLTTLGFGVGNYKDGRLEQLADKGNGSYHYIDNILEGKKIFVRDLKGTLFTIAKDVKIQVEFNPTKIKSYRLVGYENRTLQKEDFDDDKKDAGELGAGHTVTALYEIIPVNSQGKVSASGSLRFQETRVKPEAFKTEEIALVKLRYKQPQGTVSRLITHPVNWENQENSKDSDNLRFSAAVAMFGMLLRDSEHAGNATYDNVLNLAKSASGEDKYGYRSEFLRLVSIAKELTQK
jgi:Ca-activated chloride channel family protein